MNDDEDLPGYLYQPVRHPGAPAIVTGLMSEARRKARKMGISVPEALADFPPADPAKIIPGEWVEVDGRRVFMRRVGS